MKRQFRGHVPVDDGEAFQLSPVVLGFEAFAGMLILYVPFVNLSRKYISVLFTRKSNFKDLGHGTLRSSRIAFHRMSQAFFVCLSSLHHRKLHEVCLCTP